MARALRALVGSALLCALAIGCSTGAPPAALAPTAAPAAPAVPAAPATTSSAVPAPASTPEPPRGAGSGGKCRLTDVRASIGRISGEAGQRHVAVVWTNTSGTSCTMTGFGGVDLQGPADPMGPTYSLRRSSADAATVRLAPGEEAHTTITYLPAGRGWTPTTVLATPPDETHSAVLTWPGSSVLRQDGATRPGTYIGPVSPGVSD